MIRILLVFYLMRNGSKNVVDFTGLNFVHRKLMNERAERWRGEVGGTVGSYGC